MNKIKLKLSKKRLDLVVGSGGRRRMLASMKVNTLTACTMDRASFNTLMVTRSKESSRLESQRVKYFCISILANIKVQFTKVNGKTANSTDLGRF